MLASLFPFTFEIFPALPALALSAPGPWAMANGSTLDVSTGGPAATIQIMCAPAVSVGAVGPYALDGLFLTVKAGNSDVTSTINFAGGNPWTADDVIDLINPQLDGASGYVGPGGFPIVTSDEEGNQASLTFGGTALAVLQFPNATGAGNIAHNGAVTSTELATLANAAFPGPPAVQAFAYPIGNVLAIRTLATGYAAQLFCGNNMQVDIGLPEAVRGADGVQAAPCVLGNRPALIL